jgi:hypothetical protein
MHWAAALYAASIWMLATSVWQVFRPLPEESAHRDVVARVFRDVAPAILLGFLIGRLL